MWRGWGGNGYRQKLTGIGKLDKLSFVRYLVHEATKHIQKTKHTWNEIVRLGYGLFLCVGCFFNI